jgi:ribosome-binding protein aMBF1 (putative translation factor)
VTDTWLVIARRYNPPMTARIDLRSRALGIVVADAIREARTLVGWSQRELAARAGTSQATVWRIETDRAGRLDARVF